MVITSLLLTLSGHKHSSQGLKVRIRLPIISNTEESKTSCWVLFIVPLFIVCS
jgi:hypothetical protein